MVKKIINTLSLAKLRKKANSNNKKIVPLFIIFLPILSGHNFFGSWNSFFIYFIFGFYLKNMYKWSFLSK